MAAYVPGKPLVVIAGWLGCQPRSLRRYESLYRSLGFGVTTLIATPRMVVQSSTETPPLIQIPTEWPHIHSRHQSNTLQDLAWDTLRHVHASKCSVVVFHVFSNGGGFFWEQVRNILLEETLENDNLAADLKIIQSKVVGVVFDSCPAKFSPANRNSLLAALSHCTWSERVGAYAQLLWQISTLSLTDREQRADDYFSGMRSDSWSVRQLYLCSKDDSLTPHSPIEELVRHRQEMYGKDRILLCEWESSPHCCHLLQHPVDYQVAVSTFVEQCLYGDAKQQSKL